LYLAKIIVSLKKSISDPEGIAVCNSLKKLGFDNVDKVRIGKYIEVSINESNRDIAEKKVVEMCNKLLINPIMEEYTYQIVEVIR